MEKNSQTPFTENEKRERQYFGDYIPIGSIQAAQFNNGLQPAADHERQQKIQRDLGLIPPADRHPDVSFRGKPLSTLSHAETFEALQQAITHLKALTGRDPSFVDLKIG